MKKILFALFVLFSNVLVFCFAKPIIESEEYDKKANVVKTELSQSANYTLMDSSYNFMLTITFYSDGSNSLTTAQKETIDSYLGQKFSELNLVNIEGEAAAYCYDAINNPKEKITIYGLGMDSEEITTPVAFVFYGNGDGTGGTIVTGGAVGGTHTCTGAPCSCCDFLWQEGGGLMNSKRIIGCECKTSPEQCVTENGKCNHTRTSGS